VHAPPARRLDDHVRRERAALVAFVRSKIDDPDLAEDIVQDSLLRALRAAPDLRDDERMTAWLYQIVRNAVVDAYRRRGVRAAHTARLGPDDDVAAEPEDDARACACLLGLVPTLKPEYAEVVEADLAGRDDLAERLGITRDNLKVRRHRAHRQLRDRLEQTCRACAAHGCVDCTCAASAPPLPSGSEV
jgi:RNA polymerase sigma factor (sigma-70 family)